MALTPTRLEFRVELSQVDRAREAKATVVVARHPSETQRHVILRMLAWCLLYDEGLTFGPGLSTPDTPDLWRHDATGRLTAFIECGSATGARLRKAQQHHPNLEVHLVTDDEGGAQTLAAELATTRLPRASTPPTLWVVDAPLVAALAEMEVRRQRWTVTVVGDHFYIEADGRALDGAVSRVA
jgi:uncharacterized protein YaeQ